MSSLDQLHALQRKLLASRELTDQLIIESLELCSASPVDQIEKKYVLIDFCHVAAWEQAAIWVIERSLPTWTTTISLKNDQAQVCLTSAHEPPFTVRFSNASLAKALLYSLAQAVSVITRLNMNKWAR